MGAVFFARYTRSTPTRDPFPPPLRRNQSHPHVTQCPAVAATPLLPRPPHVAVVVRTVVVALLLHVAGRCHSVAVARQTPTADVVAAGLRLLRRARCQSRQRSCRTACHRHRTRTRVRVGICRWTGRFWKQGVRKKRARVALVPSSFFVPYTAHTPYQKCPLTRPAPSRSLPPAPRPSSSSVS